MSCPYVITIASSDRVGIIADVTTVISQHHGNLDQLSQTVLQGYFTMILVAHFPDKMEESALIAAMKDVPNLATCNITITPYVPQKVSQQEGETYILTASGPDKTGLVAAVCEYLRLKNININDFTSRTDDGVYTMMLMITIPKGTDVGRLQKSIAIAMEEHHLNIGIRHQAIFSKVNDI